MPSILICIDCHNELYRAGSEPAAYLKPRHSRCGEALRGQPNSTFSDVSRTYCEKCGKLRLCAVCPGALGE